LFNNNTVFDTINKSFTFGNTVFDTINKSFTFGNTVFDTINKSFTFGNTIIVVIVIVIVIIYLLCNSSKKEGFTNPPSANVITLGNVSSMDDKVAINTLAQISKSLMAGGGLTIPGDVKITGKTTIGGNTDISGATNINGATIDMSGNLTAKSISVDSIKIGDAVLSWDRATRTLNIDGGKITISSDVNIPGNITAGGVNVPGNITAGAVNVNALLTTKYLFVPSGGSATLQTVGIPGALTVGGRSI
jgi:hypothetical protein